uniref:Uncharacterized protein n=1 Tax=Globisporangium ultimum (strain ATCC 200006 / CBS 805.95 / DAOM BR144) TaxID=431595 RepID=K3X1H2_GLOUD
MSTTDENSTASTPAVQPQQVPLATPAPTPALAPMSLPTPMSTDAAAKGVPFEGLATTSSEIPYAVAQPTPSTLPPIATARPLGDISNINNHLAGGRNIPIVNGQPTQPPPMPYIMTQLPTGVDYEHSNFEFMDKCRWVAGLMLAYYIATFFFLQPFFMGVIGLMTGFVGFYGARPPMDLVRMKWIRSYIWLNYAMIVLNVWLIVITFLYVGNTTIAAGDDSDDDEYATQYYSGSSLGFFVCILVAANLIIHLRGIRTGQAFYAELVRAGPVIGPAVIIMANPV